MADIDNAIGPAGFEKEVSFNIDHSRVKVNSPSRSVRTRLYFSSESHVHAFVNLLVYGSYGDFALLQTTTEKSQHGISHTPTTPIMRYEAWKKAKQYLTRLRDLNYLTMIVCRLFELQNPDESSKVSGHINHNSDDGPGFIVEWQFSPGCRLIAPGDALTEAVEPLILLHRGLSREQVSSSELLCLLQ